MKTTLKLILLSFLFSACGFDSSDYSENKKCNDLHLKLVSLGYGCNGDICGYFHTLMLDEYHDDCFNDYDFIYLADKYLDSVKQNLPVKGITFVKPFDFDASGDSRDDEPIRKHSIVDIYYTDSTLKNKVPEITSVSIWKDGVRKNLEYMYVSSRQQRMGYYNSKKK